MKKINTVLLNVLLENHLQDKEMNFLFGGNYCTCSCYWEGKPGGSSLADNRNANYNNNYTSVHGCNDYFKDDYSTGPIIYPPGEDKG